MNLSSKVAYNTIVQLAGKAVSTALGLFTVALMTRQLGLGGFGNYTTIVTFLSFFGIIADMGLTLVTVQMLAKPGSDERKTLNNLFTLRLVSATFLLALAPVAAVFFPYSNEIKLGIGIGTASFLFIALNQVLTGLFQNRLRMEKASIGEVFGRIALLLGVYLAIGSGGGVASFIIATVFGNFIQFLVMYYYSGKISRPGFAFDFDVWKEVMAKSWPLSVTIVPNLLYLKTDTLILSILKPQTEVGIYGAAYKVIDVLVTVPYIFCGIIMPIITRDWHGKNIDKFKQSLQRSFNAMAFFAIPMAAGAIVLADSLMALVAGEDFAVSGNALKVLILAAAGIFFGSVPAHAIIAVEKQKKIIWAYALTAFTSLAGYMVFIPRYSYIGAAWVTVYSESAVALFSLYYIWKYSGFFPSLRPALKASAAALAMGITIRYLEGLHVSLLVLIGAVEYILILYGLKGISKEDLAILKI